MSHRCVRHLFQRERGNVRPTLPVSYIAPDMDCVETTTQRATSQLGRDSRAQWLWHARLRESRFENRPPTDLLLQLG